MNPDFYKPKMERMSDGQYRSIIGYILKNGILVKTTPQGIGALTCFGALPPMVFDPRNGAPLITERKLGIRNPIAEITGFVNGARTIEQLESFGISGEAYWVPYRGKGTKFGMAPNDLGPGSYGAAFHDFEIPRPWWQLWKPRTLNQFKQLIENLKKYPHLRTHVITPWKPYYTGVGPDRKVIVAPCHGWCFFRVMNGKLYLTMVQRSADVPL
ncbi:MAG TPA: thymidylate synthase, partial [Candidatus Paceibacterota bacterium]|nr:thymidylate synthase [Candidatus Paceibacterota bacterium]